MFTKLTSIPGGAGLLLALATLGCATALAINGDISGADAMTVIVGLSIGGGAVTAAHVGGSVAQTSASGASATQGSAPALPAPTTTTTPVVTQAPPTTTAA
jgi:hypothetical protein